MCERNKSFNNLLDYPIIDCVYLDKLKISIHTFAQSTIDVIHLVVVSFSNISKNVYALNTFFPAYFSNNNKLTHRHNHNSSYIKYYAKLLAFCSSFWFSIVRQIVSFVCLWTWNCDHSNDDMQMVSMRLLFIHFIHSNISHTSSAA